MMDAIWRARRRLSQAIWGPGYGLRETPPEPAPSGGIEVTVIMRGRGGKVECKVVRLPGTLPLDKVELEARAALYDQHRICPHTIDSARLHFDHFDPRVTPLDELRFLSRSDTL